MPPPKPKWVGSVEASDESSAIEKAAEQFSQPQRSRWRCGGGTGLRSETGEHGGDYPDNMPQAITVTDAEGRWAVYVPLRMDGKIVVPDRRAH